MPTTSAALNPSQFSVRRTPSLPGDCRNVSPAYTPPHTHTCCQYAPSAPNIHSPPSTASVGIAQPSKSSGQAAMGKNKPATARIKIPLAWIPSAMPQVTPAARAWPRQTNPIATRCGSTNSRSGAMAITADGTPKVIKIVVNAAARYPSRAFHRARAPANAATAHASMNSEDSNRKGHPSCAPQSR